MNMIEIIDSQEMQRTLGGAIKHLGDKYSVNFEDNFTYINVSNPDSREKTFEKAYDVLSRDPERRVMLYGFDGPLEMYLDSHFRRVMADFPERVRYASVLCVLSEMFRAFDIPKFENKALKLFADAEYKQSMAGVLLHDTRHRTEEVMKKVKEIYGIEGSIEEIEKTLMELRGYEEELNEFLPGVFCDVYGTLMPDQEVPDRKINEHVLDMLKTYSKEKPVSIWTGSELEKTVYDLRNNGFDEDIPILSKPFFRGCTAEIVIDDEDEEIIEKAHGIKAGKFIKI